MITISIVSHRHGIMLPNLIKSLCSFNEVGQIILTKNVAEEFELPISDKIELIVNEYPKGFGSNHNTAFSLAKYKNFCIVNPDVEFIGNPFTSIISILNEDIYKNSIIAPLVVNSELRIEDSARYFPTLRSLIKKMVFGNRGNIFICETNKPILCQLLSYFSWLPNQ